jgi:hypothetical protein
MTGHLHRGGEPAAKDIATLEFAAHAHARVG